MAGHAASFKQLGPGALRFQSSRVTRAPDQNTRETLGATIPTVPASAASPAYLRLLHLPLPPRTRSLS